MPDSIVGLEYLPNAHIDQINFQKMDQYFGGYKTRVVVCLYDYEDRTWSLDEKFTSYLNIYYVNMVLKSSIDRLTQGEESINFLFPGEQYAVRRIVPFSSMQRTAVTIRGKKYNKFKATVEIEGNFVPASTNDLSIFCSSMIDVELLKQNENLDLSFTNSINYFGSLKSEKVIENGGEINSTVVFRDQDNTPWSGPVHKMDTGPYMAGSRHGTIGEKNLVVQTIENFSKIRYYLPIDSTVSLLNPDNLLGNPSSNSSNSNNSSNPNKPKAPGMMTPPNYNTTHQEEYVEDTARNLSNTFITDLASVLLQESRTAKTMNEFFPEKFLEICNQSNINNIEVNRFPVRRGFFRNRLNIPFFRTDFSKPTLVAKSNNNKQKVKNKTLFKISPTEIVSVDPKTLSRDPTKFVYNGRNLTLDMLKNATKLGKIEQIDLPFEGSLRPITFTDYSVKFAKEGRYTYRMKMSMEDKHLKYCKELLSKLLMFENKIQNLYNILTMKNVFNGEEFKIEFLQEFYSQYDIIVNTDTGFVEGEFNTESLNSSYLIQSFETLNEAEILIGTPPRAPSIVNNLNLFLTDLDRIQDTADYFSKIINRFKTTYDLSDGQTYGKSSTKSRKDRGLIEKTITLKKRYHRKIIEPIGINFINMNSSTDGLPVMSLFDFDQRASKEVKKFFPGIINKNSKELSSLPNDLRETFSNIQENKFMNFSPAKIFLAGEEKDTTEINPQSFNAAFFNNLRVVKAALESEDDSETTIDEEQFRKYLDSRDFLGNTSKFNSLILFSLKRRPKLLPKIRKKFKLLDNSILKSKRRKLSLKTFDLERPNNIIALKLKKEPNKIPIQLKALSLLKTQMTNFDLKTIDFDPISNPQTQEVFVQNYLNVGKVEALMGFEKVNGRFMMDRPIYKEINTEIHNKLKNGNTLCRIVPQSLDGLGVEHSKYNVHDKVFMLRADNDNQGEEDV